MWRDWCLQQWSHDREEAKDAWLNNDMKTWGLVFGVVGRRELKHVKPSPSSFTIKLVSSLGNTKQLLRQYSWNLYRGKKWSVFSFCFTKYPGITVYLQFKHSSDFQATEFFTNSCLNYPKNVQMWSVKGVLASKQKLLVHWAKNRWTCLYAFLALSHCVCKTYPWIIILTVEMEYINHN